MSRLDYWQILERELVIAIGCTEPIAVAYAAALAKKQIPDEPIESILVRASQGIIKNAMAVNIPGVQDSGMKMAAALGALFGDASLHLEVLRNVKPDCVEQAHALAAKSVTVQLEENVPDVYVNIQVKTANHVSCVIVADRHDLVTEIELDGRVIYADAVLEDVVYPDLMDESNLQNLYDFVADAPLERMQLIELSIKLNLAVAREGLNPGYGLQVGRIMHEADQSSWPDLAKSRSIASLGKMINHVVSLTAAGSDARMGGSALPVMSNSGSGNQGICATVPVVVVAEQFDLSYDRLLRAVLLSHMITIFIKRSFGRLSAMCGAVAACTGSSCGIVYLMNGGPRHIQAAIQNMFGNVTGMLCDGAKAGCALKVATCVFAAMQSAIIALEGTTISYHEGIIESDAESTIMNLKRIVQEGMPKMNDILLDIMLNKTSGG
jgi:L-cysteine desulfidase